MFTSKCLFLKLPKRISPIIVVFIFFACSGVKMTETALYFGQSKPDGSMISEIEWNSFKQNYLAVTFKEGFSVIKIEGFWKDTATGKLITEPTYKIIYYYKNSGMFSQQIDSLRYRYQKLFQQQSVLRVDRKVKARF